MDSSYDSSMRPQDGNKGGLGTGGSRGGVDSGTIRGDVRPGMVSGNANSGAGLDANVGVANDSGINVGADTRANVAGSHGVDFSVNFNKSTSVNNGGFGDGNSVDANANNNGFGSRDNVNDSVNNNGFSDEDSQVQGDSFYTDFKQSVDALSANDGDIILGGKKKKKWLVFGIIGGIVAVVGIVALVLAIILTSEPKTGTGIKAKNYEEAFNIYANYFLFGERSKQTVNWDVTTEDGFESYFRKVVDKPFEIEAIKSGEKTVGGEIAIMDADYEAFQAMFMKLEDRPDEMTSMVEDYGKKINFLDKYYNVGVPDRDRVLKKYVESNYEEAEKYVFDMAARYENVGELYNTNVPDLVSNLGYNQLSLIEIYYNLSCVNGESIDYGCVSQKEEIGDSEYLQKLANEYSDYFSIVYNTSSNVSVDIFEIGNAITMSKTKKGVS